MLISPAQAHIMVSQAPNAGKGPNITLGDPGAQGLTGTGTQGMGTRTPKAAAVAAATSGLAKLVHTPKGRIFTKGIIAIIVPAGVGAIITGGGKNINGDGAAPMLQVAIVPIVASISTYSPFSRCVATAK